MSYTVVWLDDDLKLMNAAERHFANHGIQLLKCTTTTQALTLLRSNLSNNLLLDVEFPNSEKDGLLFLDQILQIRPNLNVVIYTAHPEIDDAVRVIKNKLAADYIHKTALLLKEEENAFFNKLHQSFQKVTPPRIDKDVFIKGELSKWRRRTWMQLILSMFVVICMILVIAYIKDFDRELVFQYYKQNQYVGLGAAFFWFIVNTFIVKNIYDKYSNHSNIANYVKMNIEPKLEKLNKTEGQGKGDAH